MRRFQRCAPLVHAVGCGAGAMTRTALPAASLTGVRTFHGPVNIACSLLLCYVCMLCFASWANNFCNMYKYGVWRFRNTFDDVIMVSDFPTARYVGAAVGALFYWFVAGPRKYWYQGSNVESMPGEKRFGPF